MPVRLLVRRVDSPTFPAPGSWGKGDIVEALPLPRAPLSEMELVSHVACDLTFQNTPDATWLQEQIDSQGGRRTLGITDAEVDSIGADGGTRTYNSAGQFISRLETKKSATAQVFIEASDERLNDLTDVVKGMMRRAQEEMDAKRNKDT